jgi:hypothetical protein
VKTVLLIGTRHDYQCPGNPGSEEFRALVAATCRDQDIKAIGEEMSLDALNLPGAKQSICEQVAHFLRIQHHYCDPSIEEQKKLGIKEPGKSSPADFSCNPDRQDIDPEQRASDAIRERHWHQCLFKLAAWPVLFVSGCNHTVSFPALLRANGIVVRVLFTNWVPTDRGGEP